MIYLLVDWKDNGNFFLEKEFRKRGVKVSVLGIANYDIKDRQTKFGSIKLYLKYFKLAINAFKVSSEGEIIICWNFTTSIPVGLINRILFRKRKIIALNIIAPAYSKKIEKIKNKIFYCALNQKELLITVNSAELIKSYSERFELSYDKFFVLSDPIDSNYKSLNFKVKKSYVFCGGEARRDWMSMIESASLTPEISYIFVARKKHFNFKNVLPENIKLLLDISAEEYYKLFEQSTIVVLPLMDDKPAGLINLLRAGMMSIPVVSSDTPSVRNYIRQNESGMLVSKNDPKDFANILRVLFENTSEQQRLAKNLKLTLIENFSEQIYITRLIQIIEKLKAE